MNNTLKVYVGNEKIAPYEFKISTGVLGAINPILYGYALKANEIQEIFPGLIEKWNFDFQDTYTLTLGNNKFHNGREINSKDVEFSIIRGFLSNSPNYNKIHFSDIAGVEKLKIGQKFTSGMADGIKVIDNKTLKIKLKNKNPIFLLNFTIPFVPIVPIEELRDDYFTWKSKPVGAGPYKITQDFRNDIVVLERVDSSSSSPKFIEFHTQRKEVDYDILFDNVLSIEKESNFKNNISKHPTDITSMFFYKQNEYGKNFNFRKAVYHAIDRDAAVGNSIVLKPAYEMMVRPYPGRLNTSNPYNPDLAKEFANKLPKSFFENDILIGVYSANDEFPPVIKKQLEFIKANLDKTGLKFKFEPIQEKFPTEEIMKKYAIKLWSKVVDLADPSISYGAMSDSSPYSNEMPDSNKKFENTYQNAIKATSFEARLKAIELISKAIETDALIVPIFQRYVLFRTNPKTIKSLGDQSKPLFIDLSLVEMQ